MVTTPAAIPVTTPAASTVAVPGALLLHVPLGVPSVNVIVWPIHAAAGPAIAAAVAAFTVTCAVALQPVPSVYDMVAIPPVPIPVTSPAPDTVATAILLLDHVPAGVASFNDVVEPAHSVNTPVMAAGTAFTVITVMPDVVLQPAALVTTTA